MYIPISFVEAFLIQSLIAVWAGLLIGGFIWGEPSAMNQRRLPLWIRMALSLVLTLIAWLWFPITLGSVALFASLCFAVGMTNSLIGDLLLADVISTRSAFIKGMIVFALAHLSYIAGLAILAAQFEAPIPPIRYLMIAWLIGSVGWYLTVWRGGKHNLIEKTSLPYTLLLSTTVAFALHLTLLDSRYVLTLIGAVLFLLSDWVLAFAHFKFPERDSLHDWVWLLYSPAQLLLVTSVALPTIWQIY